jgi:hypothetical protein
MRDRMFSAQVFAIHLVTPASGAAAATPFFH